MANHGPAGALFVEPQGVGDQVRHAVTVVGEKLRTHGQGIDVGAQIVEVAVDQALGQIVDAQGGLHVAEAQLVVGGGVLVVKGDLEAGMVANAEGQSLLVQILHRQGVVDLVSLQGEGGQKPEIIGKLLPGLVIAFQSQLQIAGVGPHQGVLQVPGEAVLPGGVIRPLGVDGVSHHLAAIGEQHRGVESPDLRVCLPHMLHPVALTDQGDDLRALGADGELQIFVFQCVFHGLPPYFTRAKYASTITPNTIRYTPKTEKEWLRT